jgi:hypothetical protein
MPEDPENKPDLPVGTAVFATTHWSVVGAGNLSRLKKAAKNRE